GAARGERGPRWGESGPGPPCPSAGAVAANSRDSKPALCAGCGGKISDRYYLLAVDKQWHLRCLKCCECKLALESELTCFAKDGSIYCKEDYYRYSNQPSWVPNASPQKAL
uniref:LIM zinc-binding domain-containing protein n=1 Tax=Cyanistes caeruleus TaxID=156563 RepID=A0A8C0U8D0_CYACU